MDSKDKPHTHNLPTDLDICESGIVFREVRKTWTKAVKSEMRLDMLKELQERNLGLPETENYVRNQAKKRQSLKFKNKGPRNLLLIRDDISAKVQDAYEAVRETSLAKSRLKRKLDKVLRTSERLKERIFRQLEREEGKLRKSLKSKNEQKISHLEKKFNGIKTENEVPEIIQSFRNIKMYTDKNFMEVSEAEAEVPIVGNVKLDEDEISVLKLPPDFAILDRLTEEEFCLETEMSMTKLRWEKRKQMEDNVEDEVMTKEAEEEREKNEEEEAMTRQIYNPVEKILDLRKRRVTDMKENSKVYLPKPLPVIEEANIAIRRDKYEQTFKEFVEEKCSKKGEQKSNLSPQQRNGLKKLQKRVADGELIIVLTDKCGRFAVADVESYLAMGAVHTSKDSRVGEEEVRRIQRLHNGHVASWLRMMSVGENHEHEDRLRESCLQNTCNVPPLYLLWKSHKERKVNAEGEMELPQTRPVVSGCSGIGMSLSNILSDVVENIANARPDPIEVISSEDMLARVHEYNVQVDKGVDPDVDAVLLAVDCVQLFPSLRAIETSTVIREATTEIINKSGLKIEGLDFKEIAKYVRMNLSDVEIRNRKLTRLVPFRKYRRGRFPGMTGNEATKRHIPEEESKFVYPNVDPTEEEKTNLFATALEIAVKFMFTHHVYTFGSERFKQRDSGS